MPPLRRRQPVCDAQPDFLRDKTNGSTRQKRRPPLMLLQQTRLLPTKLLPTKLPPIKLPLIKLPPTRLQQTLQPSQQLMSRLLMSQLRHQLQ